MSRTEDTHEVLRSRDKHILVLLLTETGVCVCISGVANEHLGKNEPRKYKHVYTQKSSIPVWSETLCVSPHLSLQDCHHLPTMLTPLQLSLSYTPLQSSREVGSVGSVGKGRLGLLLSSCPAHPSLLLGPDTSGCFPFTSSLSWRKCNSLAWKNRQQDLQVILSCYQQPDALYTLADLAQCPNWSQHTWISSPSYQIEFTALK